MFTSISRSHLRLDLQPEDQEQVLQVGPGRSGPAPTDIGWSGTAPTDIVWSETAPTDIVWRGPALTDIS